MRYWFITYWLKAKPVPGGSDGFHNLVIDKHPTEWLLEHEDGDEWYFAPVIVFYRETSKESFDRVDGRLD